MQVILTEDVVGLGDIGESVKVRPGFARNFLIPRGMAIETGAASAGNIAHKMKQIDAKKRRMKGAADEVASRLRNAVVELTIRVGSGGKVFGSIGTRDVAAKLTELGFDIDRRRVTLVDQIKKGGIHFAKVRLHPEVEVQVKLSVVEHAASKDEEAIETRDAREQIEERAAEKAAEDSEDETEE